MSNQLRDATSPYLLQHAANPVHWRQWGTLALAEALAEGKPILLSIGYAACHWCHVMAHESFEDAETAELMNRLFVNIKVDREERPDIDHIYMSALHAQGQQGGWPLTMFLTPQAAPFWGGTYFPKEARYGRASFKDVLAQVAHAFRASPDSIARNVEALTPVAPDAVQPGDIAPAAIEQTAARLVSAFDPRHGGLNGAPKFPNPAILDFLMRAAARSGDARLLQPVLLTLERICNGGICDHLGGGFARYSVDERWLVPHFEKMLYDNAQLLELLAAAWQVSGNALFRQRAIETVAWLEREMVAPGGGFCASLDADSDGVEGRFYIWTAAQIEAALGPLDAAWFCHHYDVTPEGNWHDEHTGQPVAILNRLDGPDLAAEDLPRLQALREKLLAARARRNRPGLDDKVLADWNGLQIAALVNAANALSEPHWIVLARRGFHFVCESLAHVTPDGFSRLGHSWRAGARLQAGFASDYVFMIRAALSLHEAEASGGYLDWAIRWARALETLHRNQATGLLCMAAKDAHDVIVRLSPTSDDAVPNPHGPYAMALVALSAHTGDDSWRHSADEMIAAVAASANASPFNHCSLLAAVDYRLRVAEIAIGGPESISFRTAALAIPFQSRIVVDASPRADLRPNVAGAWAIVCRNRICSLPITDPVAINAAVGTDVRTSDFQIHRR